MPATISLRLDDDLHADLIAIARARGVSISVLARDAFALLVTQDDRDEADRTGQAPVPASLTTVERQQLALLHRILAKVMEADDREERDAQLSRAEILERGYVGEYISVFAAIETELSRRDTGLVMDILDMFHILEWSYGELSDAEREALGSSLKYDLHFGGFDFNHLRESRLLTYARHLIDQGRWQSLADRFDESHDRGNSHGENLAMYERMLEVFEPIWKDKVRLHLSGARGSTKFTATELKDVAAAVVHPSRRNVVKPSEQG